MTSDHVLVVGGGIVGLSAAYFLARRGAPVTVLDQHALDGSASTGNAGMVAIGHGPLPRPGLAAQAARWIFDPLSPLHISPRPSFARLRWLFDFHRACRPEHWEHCLRALMEHGHPAGACFRRLVEEESIACELHTSGQMDVFRRPEALRTAEAEADRLVRHGYSAEVLDGAALRAREPVFRDDVVGAILYRDRAFANPGAFVLGLAEAARRHGAVIRPRAPARDLMVTDGRCHGAVTADGERVEAAQVVLAAGIWSSALARRAGFRIPMEAGKGYHLNVTAPTPPLGIASVLAETFVAATPMAGGLRLAGTLEFSGINHRLVRERVEMLVVGARRYLRGMEDMVQRSAWCGLRPCTADGLPVIGWATRPRNLFVATGHAMMGFALGPLAGRIAAECILAEGPSVDIEPFRVDRFA